MTEKELENLLNQGEGEAVECKPKLLQRHEIAEYAVGIGNAGGGYLIASSFFPQIPYSISGVSTHKACECRQSRGSQSLS